MRKEHKISVSGLVGRYHDSFDSKAISLKNCNGDEVAAAKLRKEWQASSKLGTRLHSIAAALVNDTYTPMPDHQDIVCLPALTELIESIPRAERLCRQTEMGLAIETPQLRIGGRADLVLSTGNIHRIVDWKFGAIKDEAWGKFHAPFEAIGDSSMNKALLQLAVYGHLLSHQLSIGSADVDDIVNPGIIYNIAADGTTTRIDEPKWATDAAWKMIGHFYDAVEHELSEVAE